MWRFTPVEPAVGNQEPEQSAGKCGLKDAPNFLRLLAKSRASANAYVRADTELAKGELTVQQREQIALLVAEINGSKYCGAFHERAARRAGVNDSAIQLSRKAGADDPKTLALMRFVQAVVLQRGEVSNDDFSAIRKAGFSESEIIEVTANIALNIFANYFNILAQTGPEGAQPSARNHSAMSITLEEKP